MPVGGISAGAPNPSRPHYFGTSARSAPRYADEIPGPGAYPALPAASSPARRSRLDKSLDLPPSTARSRSTTASDWTEISGVYVQRNRSKRQLRRDKRWLDEQQRRAAKQAPRSQESVEVVQLKDMLGSWKRRQAEVLRKGSKPDP